MTTRSLTADEKWRLAQFFQLLMQIDRRLKKADAALKRDGLLKKMIKILRANLTQRYAGDQ